MKRYIHAKENKPNLIIDVVFDSEFDDDRIAAATYKGFHVLEGSLMPSEKDAVIDSQVYADYESFIESVKSIITDYYGLKIYYENISSYGSFYYGALASNSDGSFILKFRVVFRISTHSARRTSDTQQHKKDEEEAVKKAGNISQNKRLPRIISKSIIVNNVEFQSYFQAIEAVDNMIADAVEVMTRIKK